MNIRFTYLLSLLSATLLAACSDPVDEYLNGEGTPTPLNVSISLSDAVQKVQSRAADDKFAAGDVLLAYFQHIDGSGNNVPADMAPALVEFKVGSDATASTSDLTVTSIINGGEEKLPSGQTTLYWDDFSDSQAPETDLRTGDDEHHHGLRTFYGYCFNKKYPAPTISDPTTGIINWSVATDQTSGIQTNDLLWSKTLNPAVRYRHVVSERVGITIPYTHAMSKVTIVLVAGNGFVADNLDAAKVTLLNMNTVCKTTAPTGTVSDQGSYDQEIQMHGNDKGTTTISGEQKDTRAFEAIVVPGMDLTNGLAFATVEDMDGNKYDIRITESIISQFNNKTYAEGDKVTLESGKNYKLVITLDKQPQTIVATITDWRDVSATGTGAIKFENNIISHNVVNGTFTNGDKITLWRRITDTSNDSFDENSNASDGITPATTSTYDGTNWINAPQIYWKDGSTNYYFRALTTQKDGKYYAFTGEDYNHDSKTDLMVYEGTDLLWGTTAAHTGTIEGSSEPGHYERGAAINPRTSTVPMEFKHIMSKVTFNLKTSTEAAAQVDFQGAELRIFGIKVGGKVNLCNGAIAANEFVEDVAYYTKDNTATSPLTSVKITDGYCFIPQDFTSNNFAVIQIKLKDGTTYSLKLNDCETTDSEGNPTKVTEWLRGKHYTYTIHLEKEAITFRALVKDWENATGSGNATLDWD